MFYKWCYNKKTKKKQNKGSMCSFNVDIFELWRNWKIGTKIIAEIFLLAALVRNLTRIYIIFSDSGVAATW